MKTLPVHVHVGFSGSRHLFDAAAHPGLDAAAFEAALARRLASELLGLRAELGLTTQHALCGISQIAIGGDFVFTVACGASGVQQCIYLPQSLDDYLAAADSQGRRDFTPDEAARARTLMASEHIVAERVIAAGHDRVERFEKVNLEILDDSDLVICLIGLDGRKRGGASAMRESAGARGKPVLLLQVAVREDGGPEITQREWLGKDRFVLPTTHRVAAPSRTGTPL